ncbi:unnamed protein product [marine sediment metagenome]|uniref:Uncharacterized protein n=1 Tax=marine sediment metagenome TaxID=412755 RepID=X1TM75_9ZZZZ
MIELEPGDIGAKKAKGIEKLAQRLTAPETDRFHHFLVWLKRGNDHLILESVAKGIAIGRLSFYEGKDIKFYRVDCPGELRAAAPIELTKWGRSLYDYFLIPKLVIQGIGLFIKQLFTEGRFRRIRPEELTWAQNNSFLCTEAVDVAYDSVGVNIIPLEVCPTPSAFKQAEIDGRIKEIV